MLVVPILIPSKKTSTVLFASEVPDIKRVLSEVMPSVLLLPSSTLIVVISGANGTVVSTLYALLFVAVPIFPELPTVLTLPATVVSNQGIVRCNSISDIASCIIANHKNKRCWKINISINCNRIIW